MILPGRGLAGAIMRENRVRLWDGASFGSYADLSAIATPKKPITSNGKPSAIPVG